MDFAFRRLVSDPPADIITAALGASSAAPLTGNDIGKLVKMGSLQNYLLAATGDDIEGQVYSVEPTTVNGGFATGSVQRNQRLEVEVGTDQGGTPMAVLDYVVVGAGQVLNTAGAGKVKTGAGTTFKWRCIRIISGTGAAGSKVLIERVR